MARLRRQARPAESPSAPGQHPRQGIHPRPRARHHRPAVRSSPRFRVNDSLPSEAAAHWQWQRGGWLLVNRLTAHISPINLPEFDAFYSAATWTRDYAAYCGVSDDGKKIFAIVAQIYRRKPVLKKPLDGSSLQEDAAPDSPAPPPPGSAPPPA